MHWHPHSPCLSSIRAQDTCCPCLLSAAGCWDTCYFLLLWLRWRPSSAPIVGSGSLHTGLTLVAGPYSVMLVLLPFTLCSDNHHPPAHQWMPDRMLLWTVLAVHPEVSSFCHNSWVSPLSYTRKGSQHAGELDMVIPIADFCFDHPQEDNRWLETSWTDHFVQIPNCPYLTNYHKPFQRQGHEQGGDLCRLVHTMGSTPALSHLPGAWAGLRALAGTTVMRWAGSKRAAAQNQPESLHQAVLAAPAAALHFGGKSG